MKLLISVQKFVRHFLCLSLNIFVRYLVSTFILFSGRSLTNEGKIHYINQFPFEQCLTVKDLLPVICRRAGSGKIDTDTLEGSPSWLPVSFNLNTELAQFVSYFQHREEK